VSLVSVYDCVVNSFLCYFNDASVVKCVFHDDGDDDGSDYSIVDFVYNHANAVNMIATDTCFGSFVLYFDVIAVFCSCNSVIMWHFMTHLC